MSETLNVRAKERQSELLPSLNIFSFRVLILILLGLSMDVSFSLKNDETSESLKALSHVNKFTK